MRKAPGRRRRTGRAGGGDRSRKIPGAVAGRLQASIWPSRSQALARTGRTSAQCNQPMSWFIPVLLAWPASDRIEVIPQPDPPVAASARVLALAHQVAFRRVDARPAPRTEEQREG